MDILFAYCVEILLFIMHICYCSVYVIIELKSHFYTVLSFPYVSAKSSIRFLNNKSIISKGL
jgi:hypothetical protein